MLNAALALMLAVAPILTTPEAVDTTSFARPREARVINVDLDLEVDFASQRLTGTATLDVLASPGASRCPSPSARVSPTRARRSPSR